MPGGINLPQRIELALHPSHLPSLGVQHPPLLLELIQQ
jgi:hypothetical protein